MERTDETAGARELLILRRRRLECIRHVRGAVGLIGQAAGLASVELPRRASRRTKVQRRQRVDLLRVGNRRDWTEDALRLVDACAVIGLNALQIRFDDAARGDLFLEDRLLDLRNRRFLNLEACRAPLRKQRHRAQITTARKAAATSVRRPFIVCGLIRSRCESGQRDLAMLTGMATRIGFIGLGTMGSPMVRRLLNGGYAVTVWARRHDAIAPLVAAGASAGDSPADVASHADIVMTMVTDTKAVEEVVLGERGIARGARAGSLVVDHSTIAPDGARRMASALTAHGVEMLDAPVSGGSAAAEAGTLAIMIGGSQAAVERVKSGARPAYAKTIVHVGASGAGQVAKACNQICTIVNQLGAAEAMLLAERAGVDPRAVKDALMGGFAASRMLDLQAPKMIARDFAGSHRIAASPQGHPHRPRYGAEVRHRAAGQRRSGGRSRSAAAARRRPSGFGGGLQCARFCVD